LVKQAQQGHFSVCHPEPREWLGWFLCCLTHQGTTQRRCKDLSSLLSSHQLYIPPDKAIMRLATLIVRYENPRCCFQELCSKNARNYRTIFSPDLAIQTLKNALIGGFVDEVFRAVCCSVFLSWVADSYAFNVCVIRLFSKHYLAEISQKIRLKK
jgi:hypothetical protein